MYPENGARDKLSEWTLTQEMWSTTQKIIKPVHSNATTIIL